LKRLAAKWPRVNRSAILQSNRYLPGTYWSVDYVSEPSPDRVFCLQHNWVSGCLTRFIPLANAVQCSILLVDLFQLSKVSCCREIQDQDLKTLSSILRTTAIIACSGVALSFFAGPAKAANLVVNGNFQLWTGGFGTPAAASQLGDSGTGGYTKLTNWTVGPGSSGLLAFLFTPGSADTTGDHDVRFNDTFQLWGPGAGGGSVANGLPSTSPNGGNYVGLDAAPAYRGTGISQTITGLVVGRAYVLNFYYAGAQQHGFDGATTEQVQATLGSNVQTTPVINLPNHGFSGWKYATMFFTATATSEALNFLSLGGPDGLPPFVLLDGVTLNETPEPGSLALMFGGILGGVGLLKWKRRRKRDLSVASEPLSPDI